MKKIHDESRLVRLGNKRKRTNTFWMGNGKEMIEVELTQIFKNIQIIFREKYHHNSLRVSSLRRKNEE